MTASVPAGTVRPLVISACGVLSPAGVGLTSLDDSLASGHLPETHDTVDKAAFPPRTIHMVPFEPAKRLGRKGTRNIDRMTMLGMTACMLALDEADASQTSGDQADTGVVLGTSTGSIRTLAELAYDGATLDRPYLINPSHFPNAVMNACAAQIAIRNSLTGPNATVSGGVLSGVLAFRYARHAIALGRASRLLAGSVEELSPMLAWGWHASGALPAGAALAEGCAMFLVEDPGARTAKAPPLAELLACEVHYCGAVREALMTGLTQGLADCITRALRRSGVTPGEITAASMGATTNPALISAEKRALARTIGRPADVIEVTGILGESYSAVGGLQLAALIAAWRSGRTFPGAALVTGIGWDGNVGCLVVRTPVQTTS